MRAGKSPLTVLSPEQSLAALPGGIFGGNSGNMFFYSSVHRALSTPSTEITPDGYTLERREVPHRVTDEINERYSHFVIPLADAFRENYRGRLRRLTEVINRLKIPSTVVGVGATMPIQDDLQDLSTEHKQDIKNFIAAVLDKSATVGVRGYTTAELLGRLGFNESHVDVIGCPSMFRTGSAKPLVRKRETLDPDARVAVHFTPGVQDVGLFVESVANSFPNSRIIAQRKDRLELLVWGQNPSKVSKSHLPIHTDHWLYREDRIRFFLDATPWISYLSGFDFAIGTRVHGTIGAISAGIPAVLLAHDTRTEELAKYHGIPHRRFSDIDPLCDINSLYAEIDYDNFEAKQEDTFRKYVDFLDHNRIPHVFAPGNENPQYDQALRTLPFPGPIHALTASGERGRKQLISRIEWLRQGYAGDRSRSEYAHEPEFGVRDKSHDLAIHTRKIAALGKEVRLLQTELAETQKKAERIQSQFRVLRPSGIERRLRTGLTKIEGVVRRVVRRS